MFRIVCCLIIVIYLFLCRKNQEHAPPPHLCMCMWTRPHLCTCMWRRAQNAALPRQPRYSVIIDTHPQNTLQFIVIIIITQVQRGVQLRKHPKFHKTHSMAFMFQVKTKSGLHPTAKVKTRVPWIPPGKVSTREASYKWEVSQILHIHSHLCLCTINLKYFTLLWV